MSEQYLIVDENTDKCLCYNLRKKFFLVDETDHDDICTFESEKEAGEYLSFNKRLIGHGDFVIAHLDESLPPVSLTTKTTMLQNLTTITTNGVQLGIGLRVAEVIRTHLVKNLRKAGVSEKVLNNSIIQIILLVIGPLLLHVLLPLIPRIKVPEKVLNLVEFAATAAIAKITEDCTKMATDWLTPMFKDIMKCGTDKVTSKS